MAIKNTQVEPDVVPVPVVLPTTAGTTTLGNAGVGRARRSWAARPSVREQQGNRRAFQQLAGHAAQDPLAVAAVSVGARH